MKASVLKYLPEAIEALIGVFRGLRSAKDAESVISYLRGLGPVYRSDIDAAAARAIEAARHSDGTGASD